MSSSAAGTYDLAVVFDHLRHDFDAAQRELNRLDHLPANVLRRIDLAFMAPSSLLCRLRFDAGVIPTDRVIERMSVAQTRHFRVLDLMHIDGPENLFDRQLKSADWSRTPSVDLAADLRALALHLELGAADEDRRGEQRMPLSLPVRIDGGPETAAGLAQNLSPQGMFIESDIIPEVRTPIWLTLEPRFGDALEWLPATVVHALPHTEARCEGRVPGFGVKLDLTDAQRSLFESFVLAAARGRAWPERSGRRYDRFRLSLPVEFELAGIQHRAATREIGRGGLFLATQADLSVGERVDLTLFSAIDGIGVDFEVLVRHRIDIAAAALNGQSPGAGMEFVDAPAEVANKLAVVLGHVELPTQYRALLLDDDSFFANIAENTLRRGGYDVVRAATPAAAREILLDTLFRFDLIVADHFLVTDDDGPLIPWLRAAAGETSPGVALLASPCADAAQLETLRGTGVAGVVSKSTPPDVLLAELDRIVKQLPVDRT